MPITASAKKSLRVSKRRAGENRATKARLRFQVKRASAETIDTLYSTLDKAAKVGVIHHNKASRLKSRFAKRIAAQVNEAPKAEKPMKKAATKKTTKTGKK